MGRETHRSSIRLRFENPVGSTRPGVFRIERRLDRWDTDHGD